MHSSFTFNPNAHRTSPNYQQQSGFQQPVYNIGAPPAFSSGFMTHPQPNLFMNHQAFARSFASVVSCDSNLGKPQQVNNNHCNSGIFGSFLKHFNKPTMQHYPPPPPPPTHQNKEFEDFTHLPSMPNNNQYTHTQHYYQLPPQNHINKKNPAVRDQCYSAPPSANNNSCNYATATTNFMASLFGGYRQRPQQQGQMKPNNSRWFGRGGFRGRGCGRWRNNPRFHDRDVSLQKNIHEKERSIIERDVYDDTCDFVEVNCEVKKIETPQNNPNETAKGSCYNKPAENPPFLIYSLEEFPAIVSTKSEPAAVKRPSPPPAKKNDEGFVVVPAEASASMPSFTPKRFSLCEKIITSPKKLFPTLQPCVLKPCLKAPRRTISESSDDFIVFADDDCEDYQTYESGCGHNEDETDSDTSSISDDDDEIDGIAEEDEDEETSDEEADEKDEFCEALPCESPEHQVDSGVEEKRVHFNLTPKVHVMRVWDYAYRAYRKGDFWQQQARDHERFRMRILNQQKILNPVLDARHRERIFRERFE